MNANDRQQGSPRIWSSTGFIAALSASGVLLLGCLNNKTATVARAPWVSCPEHWIAIDTGFGGTVDDIPVASGIDNIPEFHDCQRLMTGGQYGPLVAIWIAQAADTLFGPASRRGGAATPLEGVANVDEDAAAATPEALERASTTGVELAYAVAQIYNWDPRPYDPLAIQPGFSCLYLWRSREAPAGWEARMVPLGKNPNPCLEPVSVARLTALTGTPLLVRPVPFPGRDAQDVPPVARWDHEPGPDGNHYIGIKCGSAWCEVGSLAANGAAPGGGSDFSPSPAAGISLAAMIQPQFEEFPASLGLGAMPAAMQGRVLEVKGWYDQQHLALFQSGKLVPSGVTGTIIPHPGLDLLAGTGPLADPFRHKWIPAAYIHVDGDYHGKLELQQGVNRLWICRGSAVDCGVSPLPKCATSGGSAADAWWGKLQRARDRSVSYSCIVQEDNAGVIPAGAARWRWLETDETTWVRCSTGCCTSN